MEQWDLIIVGAGPAGLSAGIYAARSGLKTMIIEEKMAGGTTSDAPVVENYPGFAQISGGELAEKMVLHCKKMGVSIRELETVSSLRLRDDEKTVVTHKTEHVAKALIFATGSHYREIDVPGERKFRGKGVSYCAVCDGPFFKGKKVLVVGGGNSAATAILYLSGVVGEVVVVHRKHAFRAEEALVKDISGRKNVQVLWNTEVQEIRGEKFVNNVILLDNKTGETRELAVNAVFVQVGEAPNSQTAKEAGVEVDEHGYVKIDMYQKTNLPGVYGAGDVTSHPVKQVGTAVGQGITAALQAYVYIRQPYYRK